MSFPDKSAGRGYAQFPKQDEDPAPVPNSGLMYSKKDYAGTGEVELFYETDVGTVHQMTPPGGGGSSQVFDLYYDESQPSSSGNIFNNLEEMATYGDTLAGIKRVMVRSDMTIPDLSIVLSGGWEFIGVSGEVDATPFAVIFPDTLTVGNALVSNTYVKFENLILEFNMSTGNGLAFEILDSFHTACWLRLKDVHLTSNNGSSDGVLFSSPPGSDPMVNMLFEDMTEAWGGPAFVISNVFANVKLRHCDISSLSFFGPTDQSINVFVDGSNLPAFPGNESPFASGADSNNYAWYRTELDTQVYTTFENNGDVLLLYPGNIVKTLMVEALSPNLVLGGIEWTGDNSRSFDLLNNSAQPFYLGHAQNAAEGDFWCPQEQNLYLAPLTGVRIVRDFINSVWRVLLPSQPNVYDLVYDAAGVVNQGNQFNDFSTLVAVGSELNGLKRVWLYSNLTVDANHTLNGGWMLAGMGANGDPYGIRDLIFNGGSFITEGSLIAVQDLLISCQAGGFRPDGTTGTCVYQFARSRLYGDLSPVLQPTAGDCLVTLDSCDVAASAGVGAIHSLSGTLTLINTTMGVAALKASLAVTLRFFSGTLPFSTDNQISNWEDFETNVFISGNNGYAQIWNMATDENVIEPNGIDVLNSLTVITSNPVSLRSLKAPSALSGYARPAFPIINAGSGADTLTLTHDDGAGVADGKFWCPGAVSRVLAAGEACMVTYDPVNLRWVVMG